MKIRCSVLFVVIICLSYSGGYAQEGWGENRVLTLPQAFQLALKNSVQLKISGIGARLARQSVELYKLERLPGISAGLAYGSISNAAIGNGSLSEH